MMSLVRKILRRLSHRLLFRYILLFFLGVFTCLLFLQIFQVNILSTDFNDYPLYYDFPTNDNPPCDTKSSNIKKTIPDTNLYEEVLNDQAEIPIRDSKVIQEDDGHVLAHRTSLNLHRIQRNDFGDEIKKEGPTVWVVTPTFYRPEQKPELTRLAQALLPVKSFIHWIIVDDISQGSEESFNDLQHFIQKFPLKFTVLKSVPPIEKNGQKTKIVGKPRGVGGRRAAIGWLREHAKEGVVYFADDDNTYDSDIFRQMRDTKKVSMWPVGLVTAFGVSSPIVKGGRVVGFYDGWHGLRKFPVDMAGFAINLQMFLAKGKANMPWVAGYEEDELLKSLGVSIRDIRPLANNCTQILVWHTKTTRNPWPIRPKNLKSEIEVNTNLKRLLEVLPQKSRASSSSTTKTVQNDGDFSFLKFFFGGSRT